MRGFVVAALSVGLLAFGAAAQSSGPLTTNSPGSPQPVLPKSMGDLVVPVSPEPGANAPSPEKARKTEASKTEASKTEARRIKARRLAAHRRSSHRRAITAVERPALAGVDLLEPLAPAGEPPHVVVTAPAYPVDSLATLLTTPAPPVVCRRVRRYTALPDPRLVQERAVECVADNP